MALTSSDTWPNINSVSLRVLRLRIDLYDAATTGVIFRLMTAIAMKGVHSHYSEIDADPRIPDDDKTLCRLAGCSKTRLKSARQYFGGFLVSDGQFIRIADPDMVHHIRPPRRDPLSAAVRASVLDRDSRRCIYCGDTDGPFHIDHIFPHSRGGSDEVWNLATACIPCNLEKSDMTIAEWMESRCG